MSLDESRPFLPVAFAVLTVSDTRNVADDKSGAVLAERIAAAGHKLAAREIVKDDISSIVVKVAAWIADPAIDVVITTGGTGFTGRDVTPDAVRPLFEKEIDGFAAIFHAISFQKIGTSTIQSRACAGPDERDLHLLPAGLARRLPRRLGRHPRPAVRQPPPALQFRRDHAAARRGPLNRQADGTVRS